MVAEKSLLITYIHFNREMYHGLFETKISLLKCDIGHYTDAGLAVLNCTIRFMQMHDILKEDQKRLEIRCNGIFDMNKKTLELTESDLYECFAKTAGYISNFLLENSAHFDSASCQYASFEESRPVLQKILYGVRNK